MQIHITQSTEWLVRWNCRSFLACVLVYSQQQLGLDLPRRRIEIQSGVVGGLRTAVLISEFRRNRLSDCRDVGGRDLLNPIALTNGLYRVRQKIPAYFEAQ